MVMTRPPAWVFSDEKHEFNEYNYSGLIRKYSAGEHTFVVSCLFDAPRAITQLSGFCCEHTATDYHVAPVSGV